MRHTILLVEDEPAILDLVNAILTRDGGYEILIAKSGEECLRIDREFPRPIHLLLANVILPGMLGTDVAVKMKDSRPGLRVILMSGKPKGELEVLAGGWKFLKKPFIAGELLGLVRAQLGAMHRTA